MEKEGLGLKCQQLFLPLPPFLLSLRKRKPVSQQLSFNTEEGTEQQEPGSDNVQSLVGAELTLEHSG